MIAPLTATTTTRWQQRLDLRPRRIRQLTPTNTNHEHDSNEHTRDSQDTP